MESTIRVITKLPNTSNLPKGKAKLISQQTQNQSKTGKL